MGFDWIEPVYDILAKIVFGSRLQRAQLRFIDQIHRQQTSREPADSSVLSAPVSVLLLGGGTGWLLQQILQRCQPVRVLYLEASGRMLARATRRILHQPFSIEVRFQTGDEQTIPADEQFDVIITPFVLDLFTRATLQHRMIPRLLEALRPGGIWLVTDFVPAQGWWQRVLLWSMIRFFRLTAGIEARQLPDWQLLMSQAGLVCRDRQSAVGGMVSAEVWER
ncbi:class I SAM-dependent methyltransferase [Spirosoma sordidisoli]|uniref:Class I SAM-dependent methyltransferase n=1 Tax=Spirosoma sordidisoli TaxID=2502893 RepID=A0A4Q2UIZ6_9BACT|nr:class I SAM-dependent methyltransferase [Spirosoma sordidisoli]RYC69433.1 class I SAM-dependent methyltransferase [Spirosoma sordidisoli]